VQTVKEQGREHGQELAEQAGDRAREVAQGARSG
jgi:hypothetical protein